MPDEPLGDLLARAAELRERALTAEQRARRDAVNARNVLIAAGVRQPKSGVFGKPPKSQSAG